MAAERARIRQDAASSRYCAISAAVRLASARASIWSALAWYSSAVRTPRLPLSREHTSLTAKCDPPVLQASTCCFPPLRHGRGGTQGLVKPHEIIVREVEANRRLKVFDLLREAIGQAGKPAHLHPHCQVLP